MIELKGAVDDISATDASTAAEDVPTVNGAEVSMGHGAPAGKRLGQLCSVCLTSTIAAPNRGGVRQRPQMCKPGMFDPGHGRTLQVTAKES